MVVWFLVSAPAALFREITDPDIPATDWLASPSLFLRDAVNQALRSVMHEQVPKPINLPLDCILALRPGHALPEPWRSLNRRAQHHAGFDFDVLVADCCQPLRSRISRP